jgi:biotin carboxyl carrier protein
MKFVLKRDGELIEAEVERSGSGYRVRLGDEWHEADVVTANSFLRSLRLEDGHQYLLAHQREGSTHEVSFGDRTLHVQVFDPLTLKRKQTGDEQGNSGTLRALMPGRVVRVLVEKNAPVKKGQGLLILEAMKMENEIIAPKDGVVTELFVEPGQTVEGGADLICLE